MRVTVISEEYVTPIKEASRSKAEYEGVMGALRMGRGVAIHNNKPLLDAVVAYIDHHRYRRASNVETMG